MAKKIKNQKKYEERKQKLEEEASIGIDDFLSQKESELTGERAYSKKFRILYSKVRGLLVLINKKRVLGTMTNEESFNSAVSNIRKLLPVEETE